MRFVLSAIKIFSYFSFIFSSKPNKNRIIENSESDVATLTIVTTTQKW